MQQPVKEFFEEQVFSKGWSYALLIMGALLVLILLLSDEPDRHMASGICAGVFLAVFLLLKNFRLQTRIDTIGISYRFIPLHGSFRTLTWDNLEKIYLRQYRPLLEYGGYGFRYGFSNGWAYNTGGNIGIQLITRQGKKILIGTRKPAEAQAAIDAFAP